MSQCRKNVIVCVASVSFLLNLLFAVFIILEDCKFEGICWWVFVVRMISMLFWIMREYTNKLKMEAWILPYAMLASTFGSQVIMATTVTKPLMLIIYMAVITDVIFITMNSYRSEKNKLSLNMMLQQIPIIRPINNTKSEIEEEKGKVKSVEEMSTTDIGKIACKC